MDTSTIIESPLIQFILVFRPHFPSHPITGLYPFANAQPAMRATNAPPQVYVLSRCLANREPPPKTLELKYIYIPRFFCLSVCLCCGSSEIGR